MATYYFAEDAVSGIFRVPVRVSLQGSRFNLSASGIAHPTTYQHVYDWVNFVPGPQSPSLFVPPTSCVPRSARNRIRLPTVYNVSAPYPLANQPVSLPFLLLFSDR